MPEVVSSTSRGFHHTPEDNLWLAFIENSKIWDDDLCDVSGHNTDISDFFLILSGFDCKKYLLV